MIRITKNDVNPPTLSYSKGAKLLANYFPWTHIKDVHDKILYEISTSLGKIIATIETNVKVAEQQQKRQIKEDEQMALALQEEENCLREMAEIDDAVAWEKDGEICLADVAAIDKACTNSKTNSGMQGDDESSK